MNISYLFLSFTRCMRSHADKHQGQPGHVTHALMHQLHVEPCRVEHRAFKHKKPQLASSFCDLRGARDVQGLPALQPGTCSQIRVRAPDSSDDFGYMPRGTNVAPRHW